MLTTLPTELERLTCRQTLNVIVPISLLSLSRKLFTEQPNTGTIFATAVTIKRPCLYAGTQLFTHHHVKVETRNLVNSFPSQNNAFVKKNICRRKEIKHVADRICVFFTPKSQCYVSKVSGQLVTETQFR